MIRVENWDEFNDFSHHEFDDGGPEMSFEFMFMLQQARNIARDTDPNIIFHINSGSRSIEQNQQVGGKPNSSHLEGVACDIRTGDSRTSFVVVKSLLLAGFTRIGVIQYKQIFVHVDGADFIAGVVNKKSSNVMW